MATVQTGDLGKSRKQKRQGSLEAKASRAVFPSEDELYPSLCLCEENSSGTQITAANAERAGWKPLCERVKHLIHRKTWQVL